MGRNRLRLLVLGGTKFLGRAAVESALERGHEVTLFNRGQTNPELFPEAEKLRGDRDGDLRALEDRTWDVVVDPSGFVPRVVRTGAELLAANGVEHYVFVSSISSYADFGRGYQENAPLAELSDPASEDVTRDYGALKVACERVVEAVFPSRSAHIRAGVIVGPHDPAGRFTYWPMRLQRGGEVLAPGCGDEPWQFVDARDLGAWIVRVCEERAVGSFNATGPLNGTTVADVLETCRTVAESEATLTWVDDEFLRERHVGEWLELPLWVDEAGEDAHAYTADISRAVAAGLVTRPLEQTVRDTLEWASAREGATGIREGVYLDPRGVGLEPRKEQRLLAEWHQRPTTPVGRASPVTGGQP